MRSLVADLGRADRSGPAPSVVEAEASTETDVKSSQDERYSWFCSTFYANWCLQTA